MIIPCFHSHLLYMQIRHYFNKISSGSNVDIVFVIRSMFSITMQSRFTLHCPHIEDIWYMCIFVLLSLWLNFQYHDLVYSWCEKVLNFAKKTTHDLREEEHIAYQMILAVISCQHCWDHYMCIFVLLSLWLNFQYHDLVYLCQKNYTKDLKVTDETFAFWENCFIGLLFILAEF
jgi:hypothetical protein